MIEMLEKFQTEIVAGLAILLVVIIYVIIKTKQKKATEPIGFEPTQETQENLYNTDEAEDVTTHIHHEDEKEEQQEKETLQQNTQEYPHAIKAIIQDPIDHPKIHKENFKDFSHMKILLAEDNIINQKVILGLLAESGIEIVVANDGEEALNILKEQQDFYLILMDAHMPNIDGLEATRIIRQNDAYAHIPVVALSGDIASDDIEKMSRAGMQAHLQKPLKMDELYDVLYIFSNNKPTQEVQEKKVQHILNTTEGLAICGGDTEFYKEILKEFLTTYQDATLTLATLLQNKAFQDADKFLVDISGVSANIGATSFNETIIALRSALTNEEFAKIKPLYEEFKQKHIKLINEIKNYS